MIIGAKWPPTKMQTRLKLAVRLRKSIFAGGHLSGMPAKIPFIFSKLSGPPAKIGVEYKYKGIIGDFF
jgi:hypothetical protein